MTKCRFFKEIKWASWWDDVMCVNYSEKPVKRLSADDGYCHCKLGMQCPTKFQCPDYEAKKQSKT